MPKIKITVSIDQRLNALIGREVRRLRMNRSRLVEEAIRLWQRAQRDAELKEGYLAMANEDSETAESNLGAGLEAIS
ncbi:MAG: ribbon-helix-helix protein, CopG family [Planctomycetes bacterium]|nr:ribbon-helix-helix protein, CopG family [Planctomycetota bacterium]